MQNPAALMDQTCKVLIVDDDSTIRNVLRVILSQCGHTVVGEARDGQEAMKVIRRTSADLVLLDINMPGEDGLGILEQMRDSHPNVQVIMISGEATSDRVKTALERGARSFIVKPFSPASVLERVNQVLG